MIVPAFPDAGRVTIGGVHYMRGDAGSVIPVADTEFARDATFGYASSDLRQWVQEKSGGRIPAEHVASIDLSLLRSDRAGVAVGAAAGRKSEHHGQRPVGEAAGG